MEPHRFDQRSVQDCAVSFSVPLPFAVLSGPRSLPLPIPPSPACPIPSSRAPSFPNQPHPTGGWALWGALHSQLLNTLSGFISEVCPLPWHRDGLGSDPGSCPVTLAPTGHFLCSFAFPPPISLDLGLAQCSLSSPGPRPPSLLLLSKCSNIHIIHLLSLLSQSFSVSLCRLDSWSLDTHPCPCPCPLPCGYTWSPDVLTRAVRQKGEDTSGPWVSAGEKRVRQLLVLIAGRMSGRNKVVFLLQ